MEYMCCGGDLVYDVERPAFKQVCMCIPSDDSVHTVARVRFFDLLVHMFLTENDCSVT